MNQHLTIEEITEQIKEIGNASYHTPATLRQMMQLHGELILKMEEIEEMEAIKIFKPLTLLSLLINGMSTFYREGCSKIIFNTETWNKFEKLADTMYKGQAR